jgi:hypothetical protein
MTIELVEEIKYDGEPWYIVKIDGAYFKGTGNKLNAEKHYNDIINDPNIIKTKVNILKSQEINVSLEEQNN